MFVFVTVADCKAQFYVFEMFEKHLAAHDGDLNTKCLKCKQVTNKSSIVEHLCSCYGFGLWQCVYCRFGTNSGFDVIDNHIAEHHSSQLAAFCERKLPSVIAGKDVSDSIYSKAEVLFLLFFFQPTYSFSLLQPEPSSINSLTLKLVKKTLPSLQCIKLKVKNDVNANLGDEVNMEDHPGMTQNDDLQFSIISAAEGPKKPSLQIQNVVSLCDIMQEPSLDFDGISNFDI